MSFETKINEGLKEAMKAKDQAATRTLRSIKAAILLQKTDGSGEELTDEKAIKMLQKLVKQRQDSLDIFIKQGREELAKIEQEEIDVLQNYLPKPLTTDELKSAISEIMSGMGDLTIKDMGKVIGAANAKLAGKADGKTIAETVKNLLSS
ncbi:MAG: GatB/YqeY domain-containing protein [Lewinellaceae bacterium]|nr:GatB/YqeY domain-containing protein [Lewinellaceae bacterium]